jgi:hypothetical protein
MNCKVNILKQEVRIALDQNMSSDPLIAISDIDTLSLDQIIESKIEDAARVVLRDAPNYLLDGGVSFGNADHTSSVVWFSQKSGLGGGYILLPEDFLRLVSFQMSDWSRAVSVAITEDNPLYARQSSRYGGIRGCPQKPVVALVPYSTKLALEFYSCTMGDRVTVKKGTYIPMPTIKDEGGTKTIEFCEKLKPAIVYYTAYLVALTLGQNELAATLLNTSKELMQ